MDKDILKQLYELYSEELLVYLYLLCHSYTLAEDLMQETFLKAILSLPDQHTNMRAWLYFVARNLYFNHLKKHKREVPYSEACYETENDKILDILIQDEKKRMLYQALGQIEGQKKEVLILQYFSGLNGKQIADTLGLTPENVRVLSYRAKRELKHILEVNGYDIS